MARMIPQALALGAVLSISLTATSAHAERRYDCTKPGNANKAACKAAVATAPAAAPIAPTAPAAAATTRHYDCSKPGNMRKAACKGAVTTLPTTAATTTATVAPAKPSIFSRMLKPKVEPAAASASASPAAPATTSTASAASASSYKGKSITTDSAGATGQCRDGTYTHATHHSGACSRHGGVAKWMQ